MGKILVGPNASMETLQKALDSHSTVFLTDGIYNITRPLYIDSGTYLILSDKAKLRQSAKIHHLLMTRTYRSTQGYNGARDVTIEGLKIEGMAKYKTELNLVTLWHASNVKIRNSTFMDVYHFHALEINGCEKVTVEDSNFYGYVSNPKSDFREQIQIDFSSESALFLFAKGSKCYDNTCCKDIIIRNCYFDKSQYRSGASSCIGNHAQPKGTHHKNILIEGCHFKGYGTNPGDACIKLVAMDDVTIQNNTAEGFGRFVYASKKSYSYDKNGNKCTPNKEDGLCRRIMRKDNSVTNPTSNYKAWDYYNTSEG